MIPDIVKRLRVWAEDDVRTLIREQHRSGLHIDDVDGEKWAGLMEEAADEIERLRETLQIIRDGDFGYDSAEINALNKIIDAALKPSVKVGYKWKEIINQ